MLPEDQVPQLDLEVPGTRTVPVGHLGPLVLCLQLLRLHPGHHHFLLVLFHLEVLDFQVFQKVPVNLGDLQVLSD